MLVEATNTINEVDGSADAGAIKRSANEGFASMHSSIGMRKCDEQATLRKRIKAVCWAVGFANITILIIAFFSFSSKPALLAIGFSVYGLGLRHAIDADHIAAIDNVTRKLVYENSKPVTLGLFFALGHSSIVILVAVVVGTAATSIDLFEDMQITSGKLSSGVSALFLFIIAIINIVVFASIWKRYRRMRADSNNVSVRTDLFDNAGPSIQTLRPLFSLVTAGWHMFPLGLIFGLGFDTATEVALFGISAAEAADGTPVMVVLVLPMLFAAGMSLVDTTDGILMLKIYDWAIVRPARKMLFNMLITLVSIAIALFTCVVGAVRLVSIEFGIEIGVWFRAINESFGLVGCVFVGAFVAVWIIAYVIHAYGNGHSNTSVAAPDRNRGL